MKSAFNDNLSHGMRYAFIIGLLFIGVVCFGQRSDYILLKKKNNRTLKAYFNSTFISAVTYSGFELNGVIKDIRNDSVFVEQQNVYQVPTAFGVPALDTLIYTIGIYYEDIKRFNFSSHTGPGGAPRQRGFSEVALPRIMTIGGLGYIVLESVNTLYRKESFNNRDKLISMGIAAGIAGGGVLLKRIKDHNADAGGKFKVVYVKMK